MLGLNGNDALGLAEDLVIMNNIADGRALKTETDTIEMLRATLRRGVQRVQQQNAVIQQLQAQLAEAVSRAQKAEAEVEILREHNADNVAIANATSLTLKAAVEELKECTDEPEIKADTYLRKVRSVKYDSQVEKLLQQGHLKVDPRKTDSIQHKKWYVKDAAVDAPVPADV